MRKLPLRLRAYVALVLLAGSCALALGAVSASTPSAADAVTGAMLFVLASLAQRYPVHVGPKLKVTVEDAATFAAALVLSPFIAMLVAGGSNLPAMRFNSRTPLYNRLFNASASLLSTGAAAFTFNALRTGPRLDSDPLAVVVAAIVGYLVRTELVDIAIALQLRRALFGAWWLDHRRDIAQLVSLYALGALAAATTEGRPWLVVLFAAPVALILVSFRETVQLRSRTRDAILELADLIDARDKYTFGHSLRVADYAERVARRMGMQRGQIELVREAARLHDVGKISTEDRILQKAGALTDDEMAQMRRHSEDGYRFLQRLPEFWEGAQLVRMHHERYDGTGYPQGIAGDALPLEASIIAVADAWDAMTSDRPYRRALNTTEARAELLRFRGTQFHPRVLDELLAMLDEQRQETVSALAPAT